jgi:hypothetical protein
MKGLSMPAIFKTACLCTVSAAGLLLVTSCGGGSGGGDQTDATRSDLCSVLTATQIKQAIGVDVSPGTGADAPAVGCSWLAAGDGNLSTVTLLYTEPSAYDAMKQTTAQAGIKVTKVDGIGDEAYAAYDSSTAAPLLYIKKGSVIVFVSADIMADGTGGRVPQAQDLAADKRLGTIIAGAL